MRNFAALFLRYYLRLFASTTRFLVLQPSPPANLKIQRVGDLLIAAHARASCSATATSGGRNRMEICLWLTVRNDIEADHDTSRSSQLPLSTRLVSS